MIELTRHDRGYEHLDPIAEDVGTREPTSANVLLDSANDLDSNRFKNQTSSLEESAGVFRKLQRRRFALYLVVPYAALSVSTWALTVFLSFFTIQRVSYTDQQGQLTQADYSYNDSWRRAVNVLTGILSTVTLSVVSAVCARVAVICAQNGRLSRSGSRFTMRQMMTLADKGWSDPKNLLYIFKRGPSRRAMSLPLLAFAAVYLISTKETLHRGSSQS